ncbi:MAG: PAS domain S-box protein [Acidobacteria bacterium]|nr:PAS domain S-box protein [Acidobacteriota bacterium]
MSDSPQPLQGRGSVQALGEDPSPLWAGLPIDPFLRSAEFMVVALDDTGRVRSMNAAAERVTGYGVEELKGQDWFETLVPRERYPEVWATFLELKDGRLPTHLENPILNRKGEERIIAWSNQVLAENGVVFGTLSFGQDVTEQRQAQRQARESTEILSRIFDSTHFSLAYLDREFRFIRVNRAYADVGGFPPEFFPGKNHFDLFPHEENEAIFRKVVRTGEPFTILAKPFEFPDHPEWGTTYWDWTLHPLLDSGGSVESLLFVLRDVTEAKRAEIALRESEENLRITLASIGDGVVSTDPEGRVTSMNPVAESLSGWRLDEARGLALEKVIRIQVDDRDSYHTLTARDGAQHKVSEHLTPILNTEGIERGHVLVLRDVTLQAEAEANLRQAQKMDALGQLAGGIAHDFNNILTGIQGCAELLMLNLPPESPHLRQAKTILEGSEHAANLIHKLLTFSRKGSVSFSQVDVHALIQETQGILERCIDPRIHIRVRLDPGPAWIRGDAALLHTALLNLGINARDAMPEGGTLAIATSRITLSASDCEGLRAPLHPGPHLEICVSDTGHGIPPEILPRIFEPFFSTKPAGQGTGLGLAAVYGTVKNHGGALEVTSEALQGTAFHLLLPLSPDAPEATAQADEPPSTRKLKVLFIDDQELVRTAVGSLLASLGHEPLLAPSGEEGLAIYQGAQGTIDLVLLDLVMPGLSGKETFRRLKLLDPEVRVLFCSGFAPDRNLSESLELGALGLVQKPFSRDTLCQILQGAAAPRNA